MHPMVDVHVCLMADAYICVCLMVDVYKYLMVDVCWMVDVYIYMFLIVDVHVYHDGGCMYMCLNVHV